MWLILSDDDDVSFF